MSELKATLVGYADDWVLAKEEEFEVTQPAVLSEAGIEIEPSKSG